MSTVGNECRGKIQSADIHSGYDNKPKGTCGAPQCSDDNIVIEDEAKGGTMFTCKSTKYDINVKYFPVPS